VTVKILLETQVIIKQLAGDTGRGFAVVADEVRSLAQRTQSSTADIQQLVETSKPEAKNAVDSMAKGIQNTEKCLEKSDETAVALEDANQAVNSISDLNMKIAATA
jgi:methyl-accepting chemotaxis protein